MEMDHSSNRFTLIELAPGVSLEDMRAKTKADFRVSPNLREVRLLSDASSAALPCR
jgi:acyl CoA:acetate/3-ketoacid CoA transferase beta subunit